MHFKTIIFGMYASLQVNKMTLQLLSFRIVLHYAIVYRFPSEITGTRTVFGISDFQPKSRNVRNYFTETKA